MQEERTLIVMVVEEVGESRQQRWMSVVGVEEEEGEQGEDVVV